MLKIRLQRVGRKHEPVFRLVVTESKNSPKSGKTLEVLGSYDSRRKDKAAISEEKVKHWISKGAQVSDTVYNFLIDRGVIKGAKRSVLPKKIIEAAHAPKEAPKQEEAAPAAAPAAEPAEEIPVPIADSKPAPVDAQEEVAEPEQSL